MSCWSVNSFEFTREKLHERSSASAVFEAQNRTNQQTNKTCFALITHLLSIRATTSWQMLMNNEFKADTSTGNSTGNSRCLTLASRAINMSCGQSARSIKSRCVVILLAIFVGTLSVVLANDKKGKLSHLYLQWIVNYYFYLINCYLKPPIVLCLKHR